MAGRLLLAVLAVATAVSYIQANECDKLGADIVLMVDWSAKVSSSAEGELKNFLKQVVSRQWLGQSDNRLALVWFSDDARVGFDFAECNMDVACMQRKIDNPSAQKGGRSSITRALEVARTQVFGRRGDRGNKNIYLLISDGRIDSTVDETALLAELQRIKDAGARVASLAVGRNVDEVFLIKFVSVPVLKNFFIAGDYGRMSAMLELWLNQFCDTSTGGEGSEILPNTCKQDIVILADHSGSIIENEKMEVIHWFYERRFLQAFVNTTIYKYPAVRLALVYFNDAPSIRFNLDGCDESKNYACMNRGIQAGLPESTTNMKRAFDMVRTDILENDKVNRPDVKDLVIFMTDGFPNPNDGSSARQALEDTKEAAQKVKDTGAKILGISITNRVDRDMIREVISEPKDYYLLAFQNFLELVQQVERVIVTGCVRKEDKCAVHIDLAILINWSDKLSNEEEQVKTFLSRLISRIRLGDKFSKIGIILMNQNTQVLLDFDSCRYDVECMNRRIQYAPRPSGRADVGRALEIAGTRIFRNGGRSTATDVLLLVTDTMTDQDRNRVVRASQDLKGDRVRIAGIGVSDPVDVSLMLEVVSDPWYDNVFTALNFRALNQIIPQMWDMYCVEIEKPPTVPPPTTSPPEFDCMVDLILLVDHSGSIVEDSPITKRRTRTDNWVNLQAFLREFGKQIFAKYNKKVHLGLVWFSDRPFYGFNLGDCDNNQCMQEKTNIKVPYGTTHMADAFQFVKDNVTGSAKDRPDVDNIIIFLTDGFPNPEPDPYDPNKLFGVTNEIKRDPRNKILGIGITDTVNKTIIERVVSDPPSYYHVPAKTFAELYKRTDEMVEQSCKSPEKCQLDADAVIMIEWSSSISEADSVHIRNFLRDIINKVQIGEQYFKIAIIWVNDDAQVGIDLNQCSDPNCIIKHIYDSRFQRKGRPNFVSAIEKTLKMFQGPGVRADATDSVLLFMEGRDINDKANFVRAVEKMHQARVRVVAVPVSEGPPDPDIEGLVSKPWNLNYFPTSSYRNLNPVINGMWDRICFKGGTPAPTSPPVEDCFLDIALLVDHSGSIIEDDRRVLAHWLDLKKFVKTFVTEMKARYKQEVQLSLTFFAGMQNLRFNFGDCDRKDPSCMTDKIDDMKEPFGQTHMAKAFQFIDTNVFSHQKNRKNVSDVLLFLTDGFPYPPVPSNVQKMYEITDKLKQEGVVIYGIGVTDKVNNVTLKRVASNPDDLVLQTKDFRELVDNVENLVVKTCTAACLGEKCDKKIDVTILIDTSTSMVDAFGEEAIRRMLAYLIHCIQISRDKIRLAVVYYNSQANILFNLDECDSNQCAQNFVNRPMNVRSGSDLANALRVVKNQVFNGRGGDRSDAVNSLLVISSNEPAVSDQSVMDASMDLRRNQVNIFALGVGTRLSHLGFKRIVSDPNYYRFSNTIPELRVHVPEMKRAFCVDVVPTIPPNKKPNAFCPYDISLLVDVSGSIEDPEWVDMKNFLYSFVSNMGDWYKETKLAMVTFAGDSKVMFNLDTCKTKQCILDKVNKLPLPGGSTDMLKAFEVTKRDVFDGSGNRGSVDDLIMFLTDGFPNPFKPEIYQVTNQLKSEKVRIVSVGLGDDVNENILNQVSSQPEASNVFRLKFKDLASRLYDIINATCITPEIDCKDPGDVVFVFDSSGSIGGDKFNQGKDFIANLINQLPIEKTDMRIGVVQFSDNYELVFHLNKFRTDKAGMIQAVETMKHLNGRTNTPSALRYVRDTMFTSSNGDRDNRHNIVVVLTDGGSNKQYREDTIRQAVRLHEKATVLVVQVGNWVNEYELKAIASHPYDKHRLVVEDYSKLPTIYKQVLDLICNNVDPCNGKTCKNGGTLVNSRKGCMCSCPDGYMGADCGTPCEESADVVFAVDTSGSMHENNLLKVMDFCRTIVFDLNFATHRVGLLSYSDNADIILQLGAVTDKEIAVDMFDLYRKGGRTKTGEALRKIREQMFTSSRIRRDRNGREVPRVVVLIVDSRTTDKDLTWNEARKLREAGVRILVVGIGKYVDRAELYSIASHPVKQNTYLPKSFDDLKGNARVICDALCNNGGDCSACPEGARCEKILGQVTCIPCPDGRSGPFCKNRCDSKMDLGLLLDVSGSIRNTRWMKIQAFVDQVLSNMTIGPDSTRVAAVSWSDSARRHFNLNEYKYASDVIHAIHQIDYIGRRTNTQNALDIMRQIFGGSGERREAPNVVLMITDGGSNIQKSETIRKAMMLKRERNAHIAIVAIGDDMNMYELRSVASAPPELNIFKVVSELQLPQSIQNIAKAFCDENDECSSNPCRNNARCLNRMRYYECQCQGDYVGFNCERRCSKRHDIVVLADVSGSVYHIYNIIMAFARRLVMALPFSNGRTYFGAYSFADNPSEKIRLNQYRTREDNLIALALERTMGRTNMAGAIDSGRNMLRSGRSDAEDVLVLLTDGVPTVNAKRTPLAAEEAKRNGVKVITIGVGDETDSALLKTMASDPATRYNLDIKTPSEIDNAVNRLLEAICL